MDTNYILSQICVILAVISLGSTFLIKDKRIILLLSILIAVFYGLHYLLLDAITGLLMNMVSIVRSIWFYINAKKEKKNSIVILIVLFGIIIISGLLSFQNIYSILPIIATSLYTYSIWQDDIKIYRWIAIPISLSWITYNISTKSIFGIITELVLFTIEIIGIIKIYKKDK